MIYAHCQQQAVESVPQKPLTAIVAPQIEWPDAEACDKQRVTAGVRTLLR